MVKRTKIQKLEDGLTEVKKLVKEFKQKNGNGSCRVLNKDMLFFLLAHSMDSEKRISRLEGALKILILIIFTIIGLRWML